MNTRRWVFILGAWLLAAAAQGAEVQGRLIRASNDQQPADAQLRDLAPALHKKFGYGHYEQLGAGKADLEAGKLQRLDVGEGFTVFVKEKSAKDKKHELEVEWYSGKASLVKSTVTISEGRSVLVSGPAVGEKLIVLALTVR